jgi:hypothetical protein
MAWSLICYIVATVFAVIGTLLLIGNEGELAGLDTLAWFAIGFVFFIVAHYVPGGTRG